TEDLIEAQNRLADAAQTVLDKLRQRIASERALRKAIAEGADSTVENLKEELAIQNETIAELEKQREAAYKKRREESRKNIEELQKQYDALDITDNDLSDQERASIAERRMKLRKELEEAKARST